MQQIIDRANTYRVSAFALVKVKLCRNLTYIKLNSVNSCNETENASYVYVMRKPLCFCNGVIRSGSTWSFNVCRALFLNLANERKQPFGSTYLDLPYVEQFVAQNWQRSPGPTVIKNHMIGPQALAAVRAGEAKAVCTFRDPRDCVASDMRFMDQGFDFSVKRVTGSLEFLKYYQSTPHILLVRYEAMMADRLGQIRRIAEHLGIAAADELVTAVDTLTNLDMSKELCRQLRNRPANTVLNIQSHRVDPSTHLHENHIGSAASGKWKTELSGEQGRWLTEYFQPWLIQWGYETPQSAQILLGRLRFETESNSMNGNQGKYLGNAIGLQQLGLEGSSQSIL